MLCLMGLSIVPVLTLSFSFYDWHRINDTYH